MVPEGLPQGRSLNLVMAIQQCIITASKHTTQYTLPYIYND